MTISDTTAVMLALVSGGYAVFGAAEVCSDAQASQPELWLTC